MTSPLPPKHKDAIMDYIFQCHAVVFSVYSYLYMTTFSCNLAVGGTQCEVIVVLQVHNKNIW